uniref:Metalloendopeptidase n=1 Tax=Panagrolaimus sp. JU765 TaxID=591449 RepID=A0AC34QLN0_9BILA
MIRNALNEIESKTCLRFQYYSRRPSFNHIYYVKIASSSFCGLSYIGRVSPANPIYLSFLCPDFPGIIIHETLHTLGVIHQHLRTDRDEFIRMEWSNMNPQYYDHFAIADASMFSTYGVPYDYYSIMHYNAYAAAINPSKPTLTPLTQTARFLQVIGQRKKLSDRDVELLNTLYCGSNG